MTEPAKVHLACSADAAYAPHSAAMIDSALAHGKEAGVAIHYLHDPEFPAEAAERIGSMVERAGGEISFRSIAPESIEGLPAWEYIPRIMWLRILLPELLPELERVLYLDVDTIVLDSLEPLFELELEDHYLGAVTNVFQPDHAGRLAELGLEGSAYFNSGVLLFNLEAMRREGCARALREFALEHADELLWPDQDALNLVLGGRRLPLHPRWNLMNSALRFPHASDVFGAKALAEARERPAIRHFEGPAENKPWHYLFTGEGRELYLRHRRRTPWPRVRIEGRTPRNALRRARRALG